MLRHGLGPAWRDLEHRTASGPTAPRSAAGISCAIKITVAALNKASLRPRPVTASVALLVMVSKPRPQLAQR
jgi:hypothetical protein